MSRAAALVKRIFGQSRQFSGSQTKRMGQSFRLRRGLTGEALEQKVMLSADPIVSQNPAGAYTVTFGTTDDVVSVELISTEASDNGGVIVSLSYIDDASILTKFNLCNATTGVVSLTIDGGGGSDRCTVDALGKPLTIRGGAGTDSLIGPDDDTNWTISGLDTGSATGISLFDSVENLAGRSGTDEFTLNAAGSITGTIDGGDGDDRLTGPNTPNVWTLSGEDAGRVNNSDSEVTTGSASFEGIENITGGDDVDHFFVTTLESITGEIAGGGGTDTLIGADDVNSWSITGDDTGTLNDADFIQIENLTGGSGDDTFGIVGTTASLSGKLDGGLFDIESPTVNSVNYSQRGAAVTVNLTRSLLQDSPAAMNRSRDSLEVQMHPTTC